MLLSRVGGYLGCEVVGYFGGEVVGYLGFEVQKLGTWVVRYSNLVLGF